MTMDMHDALAELTTKCIRLEQELADAKKLAELLGVERDLIAIEFSKLQGQK
jgi:hypothetical protein